MRHNAINSSLRSRINLQERHILHDVLSASSLEAISAHRDIGFVVGQVQDLIRIARSLRNVHLTGDGQLMKGFVFVDDAVARMARAREDMEDVE